MDLMEGEMSFVEMMRFSGLNNVDDSIRLRQDESGAWPLVTAENIIIDNTGRLKQRAGYTNKVSLVNTHSLWANEDDCFFVYQDKLYKLNIDYSYTLIRSGLMAGMRLSYARANNKVYYSNGSQIGYIDSTYTDNAIANPSITFKYPLPAGKFIEFYKARLYSAKDTILSYSDVLADYYDNRINVFQFPSNIKMVLAVDNGVYVSDSDKIYFMAGQSPFEMTLQEVYSYSTIPYTGIKVDAHYIGAGGVGTYGMWTSIKGVCIGDSNGNVINITDKRYSMSTYGEGASLFDNTSGFCKYITILTN
jgi:hypothetical protein